MDQRALIEQARYGDQIAFAALVRHYQEMVLGYAAAIVHDVQLAEDVTQETLVIAYRTIGALDDPGRFPAWLRGIVRFQCSHLRRRRCLDMVPLDESSDIGLPLAGPEQQLEIKEGFHRVLAAIQALPDSQREVAMLFYIKDYSQREVAAFLEVPVTTVNNRLHAARVALKARLRTMNGKTGHIVSKNGQIVDVQFESDEMPLIFSELIVTDHTGSRGHPLQVVQRVGQGLVRCLAGHDQEVVEQGTLVTETGGPHLMTLDATTLTEIMPVLIPPIRQRPPKVLETGIKVIDLLCPLAQNGTAGIFGPSGTGRIVVTAEILHNLARDAHGLTLIAFVHGEAEARGWYETPAEVPIPAGNCALIGLPIDNAIDLTSPHTLAVMPFLDTRLVLSSNLGKSGIWPAIDPLLSTSPLLDPAVIGPDHFAVATAVRQLLRAYRDIQEGTPVGQPQQPTTEQGVLIGRARKIQRFFTQPFTVAAPFTGRPGQRVPLAETIRTCRALLAGEYDTIPEEDFMWLGEFKPAR